MNVGQRDGGGECLCSVMWWRTRWMWPTAAGLPGDPEVWPWREGKGEGYGRREKEETKMRWELRRKVKGWRPEIILRKIKRDWRGLFFKNRSYIFIPFRRGRKEGTREGLRNRLSHRHEERTHKHSAVPHLWERNRDRAETGRTERHVRNDSHHWTVEGKCASQS